MLFRFDDADTGMRNLAMVALAEVAVLFGLSADYFSMLRVAGRRGARLGGPARLAGLPS